MSVWDSITVDNGDYVTFEDVGDSVTGVITGITTKTWPDGKTDPQLTLRTPDGDKTLTAGQVRLKQWLIENKPAIGDTLWIKLREIEKRTGGKTMKHFDCAIQAKPGTPAEVTAKATATADDDAPPWATRG